MKSNLYKKLMCSSVLTIFYFACVSQAIAIHSNGNQTAVNATSVDLKSSATNDKWVNENLDKIEKSVSRDEWKSEEKPRKSDRNYGDQGTIHWYNQQVVHELKRDPNGGKEHWAPQKPQHRKEGTTASLQNKYNNDQWSNSRPKYGSNTGLQHWKNSIPDDDCDGWNIPMYKDNDDHWLGYSWNLRNTRLNSQRSDGWSPSNKPRCDEWHNTYADDIDSHWGYRGNSGKQNNNYGNSHRWCRSGEKDFGGWTESQGSSKGFHNDKDLGQHWGWGYDNQNNGWAQNRINPWGENDDDDNGDGWSDGCKNHKCQREQIGDGWGKPSGWVSEQHEPQDWSTVAKSKRFLGGVTQKGSSESQSTEHKDFSKTKWLAGELSSASKKPHWN